MDKKRPSRNKAMSIFQDASSRESTPDPFSDADGEYGSDQDYDPDPRTSSESDTSVNIQPSCSKNTRTTTSTHESSESDTSSSEDCSSSSASIFDTRIVKTQRVTVEIEPVNTDEATTVSMESLAIGLWLNISMVILSPMRRMKFQHLLLHRQPRRGRQTRPLCHRITKMMR
ncbi:hypothetical protein ACJJTC_018561 [Scirpophaga incertulas]